jgi:heat shock protein HslJ
LELKVYLTLALILIISLLSEACSKCGDEWQDITWKLKSYGPTNNLQTLVENTNITAQFESEGKRVTGSSGCNSYFADYSFDPNKCELGISVIGATKKACLEPRVMQQEKKYFELLQNADKITVKGGELTITSSTEVLIYIR